MRILIFLSLFCHAAEEGSSLGFQRNPQSSAINTGLFNQMKFDQ